MASACGGNAQTNRVSAISGEDFDDDAATVSEESFRQASLSTRIKIITV